MKHFLAEKRTGIDRRKKRSVDIRLLIIGGRREKVRRKEDMNKAFYADRYRPSLFGPIVIIIFLSVIDALLTLFLIGHGAFEINPIMAYYLKIGPYTFFTVKYTLTSIGVVIFLILSNNYLRTTRIYYTILTAFITVVAWEFYLIFSVI
ncbi:MAG: hypothetical protein JSV83_23610 [Desulfobacterales bacterium]|nr:MAG: hypothetical protein JSV83_23610 [Desulfobacterales bacterium]